MVMRRLNFIVFCSHISFAPSDRRSLSSHRRACNPPATPSHDSSPDIARRRACAAFTMVEVVVAMAIIGFLVVALYAAIATSVGLVKSCQENERVTQILSEKMDTIRLYN